MSNEWAEEEFKADVEKARSKPNLKQAIQQAKGEHELNKAAAKKPLTDPVTTPGEGR